MNDEIVKDYWGRVNRFLPILRFVPNLRMVAVCNNLAFGKVSFDSDIDLFIVAKKGRLFTVRSVVTLLLHLKGVRRHGNKVAGRFCLSFFVDDSALNLKSIAIKRDVYLAYWTKSMLPVIDDGVGNEFVRANSWARDCFADAEDFSISHECLFASSWLAKAFRRLYAVLDFLIGGVLELVLKTWQLRRARKKAVSASSSASLVITEHVLKFHNVDRRQYYRDLWQQKYGKKAKLKDDLFLAL